MNEKPSNVINTGLGELEKVRDILFGTQIDKLKQELFALEERIDAKLAKIRDFQEKLGQDTDKIIKKERDKQKMELQVLQDSISEVQGTLRHTINEMEDSTEQNLKGLKELLKLNHEDINHQILQTRNELQTKVESQNKNLSEGKLDRDTLAAMFNEMAAKLLSSK